VTQNKNIFKNNNLSPREAARRRESDASVTHFFTHLIVPNVFWLRRRVFHPFCPYCYQISGVTLTPPLENQRASSLFDPRRIYAFSLREIIAIGERDKFSARALVKIFDENIIRGIKI
jgi:hypothetical protein